MCNVQAMKGAVSQDIIKCCTSRVIGFLKLAPFHLCKQEKECETLKIERGVDICMRNRET